MTVSDPDPVIAFRVSDRVQIKLTKDRVDELYRLVAYVGSAGLVLLGIALSWILMHA